VVEIKSIAELQDRASEIFDTLSTIK